MNFLFRLFPVRKGFPYSRNLLSAVQSQSAEPDVRDLPAVLKLTAVRAEPAVAA